MRFVLMTLALAGCATDALEPPTGETVEYSVIDQTWPFTNKDAQQLGLDLNGDKTVDNQLGMVFASIEQRRIAVTGDTSALIHGGALRMVTSLQYARDSDPSDSIAFATSVAGSSEPPLLGEHTTTPMLAGPGDLDVAFAFCGEPVTLPLGGARVRIDRADPTTLTGLIGGGVRKEQVDAVLVPMFARRLNAQVALECTDFTAADCGCIHTDVEYEANYWLEMFDAGLHKDCVITPDEIKSNSLFQSLVAPDVTIDGEQRLSIGFRFEAAR